jgi:hypothetical protein
MKEVAMNTLDFNEAIAELLRQYATHKTSNKKGGLSKVQVVTDASDKKTLPQEPLADADADADADDWFDNFPV